jgi:hypothetical protein
MYFHVGVLAEYTTIYFQGRSITSLKPEYTIDQKYNNNNFISNFFHKTYQNMGPNFKDLAVRLSKVFAIWTNVLNIFYFKKLNLKN